MKLIAGLGNPGPQYDSTRHNVGFMVLDRLARRCAPGAVAKSKFNAAYIDTHIDGERTVLLKPLGFMNRSGGSVAEAARFFKIDPATDLLVVVDDVALDCGGLRMRRNGSPGGHNGLADIAQKLGSSDFPRLRIGIDPPGRIPQKDYVLGKFRDDQLERLEPALEASVDAVRCWVTSGIDEAMNRFNLTPTPSRAGDEREDA